MAIATSCPAPTNSFAAVLPILIRDPPCLDGASDLQYGSSVEASTGKACLQLHAAYTTERRLKRRAERKAERDREPGGIVDVEQATARDWKEELLEALLAIPPDRFERLAQRLLREAGFISGDGLCDLLKKYDLGVRTTVRQIEEVAVQPQFFEEV